MTQLASVVALAAVVVALALLRGLPEESDTAFVSLQRGESRLLERPLRSQARGAQIVPQPVRDGSFSTFAASSSHVNGFCSAIAAVAVTSAITCFARTIKAKRNRIKYNKPTQWQDKQLGYRLRGPPGFCGSPHTWTENIRWCYRFKRRIGIRKKVEGKPWRPRLAIFRGLKNMQALIVDDTIGLGQVLLSVNTMQKDVKEYLREKQGAKAGKEITWTAEAADQMGEILAKKCLEKQITYVAVDRGGFAFAGRVKALVESMRQGGVQV